LRALSPLSGGERSNLRIYLALVLAMIFWGYSFIWYKQAYPEFQPITIVFFRLVISAPLLLLFSLILKRIRWPGPKDIKYFLLLSLFEPLIYFLGESYGMQHISSTLAAVIIATIPLFTPFVGILLGERLTTNNYLGLITSFLGVLMVVYVEGTITQSPLIGILLMFMAVLSTQGYALVLKRLSKEYNALTIVSFQNLLGAVYFLPLFLLIDFPSYSWQRYTFQDFLPVIYLALFASTFSFVLFIQGVRKIGIAKSTVFTNFIPVVTAIIAIQTLGEEMTLLKGFGIFVTIFGLFMSQAGGISKVRIYSRVLKK
jgi:drug/metabolite transporter (DMT)-like permease